MQRLLMLTCFILSWLLGHGQESNPVRTVKYPAGYTAALNVVYTQAGDWEGKMDLYLPPQSNGIAPVVINIHGGGWNHGTKESQTGFSIFFKQGYAVANIEYRLVHQGAAPAAIEDARCALLYLIRNAGDLNIDVNKIVVMGGSAGGHLALMAGLLESDHTFDTNCLGVENIKVAAIINKYGVTDLYDWSYGKLTSKSAIRWLGDKAKDKNFIQSVSPISYVKKTSPPVFIVHGDADPTVPYYQSVTLHEKLQKNGVKTKFVTVRNGLHGKFPKGKRSEVNTRMMEFLKALGIHE